MADPNPASVCIVGAGSAGIVAGYHLSLSGAAVTYLVRPHREEQLSRPQLLYCYDDHRLKTFSGFKVSTDPAGLDKSRFDFVIVTLDGAALRAEAGRKVVEAIGQALRDTSTGVILSSVGIDLRPWFLGRSGLDGAQVTHGGIGNLSYEAPKVTLPLHDGVKPEVLADADYGYRHLSPDGFIVDRAAPKVAEAFAELYGRSGISTCGVMSPEAYKLTVAMFGPVIALELLDWPAMMDVNPADEIWRLGSDAMREMQRLRTFGQAGVAASEQTSAESNWQFFRQMEEAAIPLDLSGFNRYHHGGKVSSQDHDILREALKLGETEGLDMPALRTLVERMKT